MKALSLLLLLAFPLSASALPEARRVTGPEFSEAKQPRIAISESGTIHITFGMGKAVFTTRSEDAGATFSEPIKVGELEKLALGMRRGPRIATAGQAVVITAISHADGELHSWRSVDRGRSWSNSVKINDAPKAAVEGLHDLASDGQMRVSAVWLDLRNGKTELWASASDDAGGTWDADTLVYRSPDGSICECCHPSVVFTPAGDIVVMWRNSLNGNRDMYHATSSDGGRIFSEAKKLGDEEWTLNACPMDGGNLAVNGEEIAYAWRRAGKLLFTTDPGSEQVLAGSGTQPVVVRSPDEFIYAWQDQGNLFWRTSSMKERALLAPNAGFAASAWSNAQEKSFLVWEGQDGVFVTTFPQE